MARRGRAETEKACWWSLMELGDSSIGFRTASSGNNDSEEVLVLRATCCRMVRPAIVESNIWFDGREWASTSNKLCDEYSKRVKVQRVQSKRAGKMWVDRQGLVEPPGDRCVTTIELTRQGLTFNLLSTATLIKRVMADIEMGVG